MNSTTPTTERSNTKALPKMGKAASSPDLRTALEWNRDPGADRSLQTGVRLLEGKPKGKRCEGNRGTGSCGALPPDFECTPTATGPGVYHGDVPTDPYTLGQPLDLSEYGGVTCVTAAKSRSVS